MARGHPRFSFFCLNIYKPASHYYPVLCGSDGDVLLNYRYERFLFYSIDGWFLMVLDACTCVNEFWNELWLMERLYNGLQVWGNSNTIFFILFFDWFTFGLCWIMSDLWWFLWDFGVWIKYLKSLSKPEEFKIIVMLFFLGLFYSYYR